MTNKNESSNEQSGLSEDLVKAKKPSISSRRAFVVAASAGGLGVLVAKQAQAITEGPLNPTQRRDRAFQIRSDRATANRNATNLTVQPTNGDEEQLANKIGNFTKGLPHDLNTGEVNIAAFNTLDFAIRTGTPAAFEAVTLGGTRKLTNPQAGLAFEMEGGDGPAFKIPAPPKFNSREMAAEIAENYWMALLRDVPFSQYPASQIAIDAAADLNVFGVDAKVPKNSSGLVTPDLLFRGFTPGDRVGPWLAQFFYQPCPFGANLVEQRIRHPLPGVNFMTDWNSFVTVQNGVDPGGLAFENVLRYMRDGRGLGEWVHVDVLFQAYFMAFLVLSGLGAPVDAANPYKTSAKQAGFATFGGPHIATLLCEVSTRALHATWYQKWFAHRRVRPEAFAGAIHARLNRGLTVDRAPVHQDILTSINSSTRLGRYLAPGNALLPMAFAEGSPTHPSYTAGHATVAGACTTILKAFFDESFVIPNALQPSDDGLSLLPFTAAPLTVGGELNKIASNIANARNVAGVHWRSDSTNSMNLGEAIAIQLMQEHKATFNESFAGHSLTKFDGTTITI